MDTGQKLQIDFIDGAGLIPEHHGVYLAGLNENLMPPNENEKIDLINKKDDEVQEKPEMLQLRSIVLQKNGIILEYWTIPMYEQLSFSVLDSLDMTTQAKLEKNCLINQQIYIDHLQKVKQKAMQIAERAQYNLDQMLYASENVNAHADCVNDLSTKQLKLLSHYQEYPNQHQLEAPYYGKSIKTYLNELETRRQLSIARQQVSKLRMQVAQQQRKHNGVVMVYDNENYTGIENRPVHKSYTIDQERYVPAQRVKVREQAVDAAQFNQQVLASLKKLKRNAMHEAVQLSRARKQLEVIHNVLERWIKQNSQIQRQLIGDAVKRTRLINENNQKAKSNEMRRNMIHSLQENILITANIPMRAFQS